MAAALTVTGLVRTGTQGFILTGTIALTGNYTTGGDALDLTVVPNLPQTLTPDFVLVLGIAGYVYAYNIATKKLLTLYSDNNNAADGPMIEIPGSPTAYPAGVTGDTVTILACYFSL